MIGDKIRKRREELRLSQEDLAQLMGYTSRSTINKIEKGINDIPQSKIVAFAKALNTTPSYLMDWEEPELLKQLENMRLTEEELREVVDYAKYVKGKRK